MLADGDLEEDGLRRKPVEMWGLRVLVAVGEDVVRAHRVLPDEDDVDGVWGHPGRSQPGGHARRERDRQRGGRLRKPEFLLASAWTAKRDKVREPGMVMLRAGEASGRVAATIKDRVTSDCGRDVESLRDPWLDLLDKRISAPRGQMASLLS